MPASRICRQAALSLGLGLIFWPALVLWVASQWAFPGDRFADPFDFLLLSVLIGLGLILLLAITACGATGYSTLYGAFQGR
ncbi:MAG TPA: hypothetical protein VN648_00120 [Candidatus Methylomirabilis sp.]|nr:hypothetical protein [Candidatus Methylomirabilis sp.]